MNAVPGPGSYEINQRPKSTKKGLMFTTFVERFSPIIQINDTTNQKEEKKVICRKKYKAKSSKVAFGSTKQKFETRNSPDRDYRFYQDYESI